MNRPFLTLLRDHLLKIAATPGRKRRFNLNAWFVSGQLPSYLRSSAEGPVCGTSACALGEACFIPELRAAGLTLTIDPRGRPGTSIRSACVRFYAPSGEPFFDFDAAEAVFGIESHDARRLFDQAEYPPQAVRSPRSVARRIDELLARPE